jgi:transposase
MIVIGADTHKGSHALAAVHEGTGRVRGSREIKADDAGHLAAVRWARGLDEDRVWAIEDCRSCSRRLEQVLLAAGERVVRVPPHRMGASRKGEREPGKSDEIDALAVARAVVKDGVEQFPVAYLNEQAMEIRLLSDHRNDLVAQRTRTVNRLRWHLLELCPEIERSVKRGALTSRACSTGSTAPCGSCRPARGLWSRASRSHRSATSTAKRIRSRQTWQSSSRRTVPSC